jgi:hypothetical protein
MSSTFAALQLSIANAAEPIATLIWGIVLVLISSKLRANSVVVNRREEVEGQTPTTGRLAALPERLARTFTSL